MYFKLLSIHLIFYLLLSFILGFVLFGRQERRARALQQRLAAEAKAKRRAEKRALALVPEEGQ